MAHRFPFGPARTVLLAALVVLAGVAVPVAADGFVSVSVDVQAKEPVPEEPFPVNVTVGNAESSDGDYIVTDLVLREGRDRESDEVEELDVSHRLAPGATRTFTVRPTLNETGQQTTYLHLQLLEPDGDRRRVVHPVTVTVHEPDPQLELAVSEAVAGADRRVNVTVANGLESPVRQLHLTVATPSGEVTFGATDRVRAVLAAEDTATFTFPARVDATGRYPVEVSLSYTLDDNRRTVAESFVGDFTEPRNPGRVRLTGLSVAREGDVLAISGSASNLGSDSVDSVVVSVLEGEAVTPAQPQPDYFVGTVEGSDFVSFDLNARVRGNVSSVPVRVEYVVDGVERSSETTVPVGPEAQATPVPARSGSGLRSLPLAAVAAVAVALLLVVGWRRR